MSNNYLFRKLKKIKINKFNHFIYILTILVVDFGGVKYDLVKSAAGELQGVPG
jgi:hypothetical protein